MTEFWATIAQKTIHAWMPPGFQCLVSASSAWSGRKLHRRQSLPVRLYAVDSGGFAVMTRYGGIYPYSLAQYVEWAAAYQPLWLAVMDYPVLNPDSVTLCQRQTTENTRAAWQQYPDLCWTPVIQGASVADYVAHALELKPVIDEMRQRHPSMRVGIGSLVRSDAAKVEQVCRAVSTVLDAPLHLFGVALKHLKGDLWLRNVISVDSALWQPSGQSSDGVGAKSERESLMLSQISHAYRVGYPRYEARLNEALRQPRQGILI